MLGCYRVLDLTSKKGFLCGKALDDFGADVIRIEKPGGGASMDKKTLLEYSHAFALTHLVKKHGMSLNINNPVAVRIIRPSTGSLRGDSVAPG